MSRFLSRKWGLRLNNDESEKNRSDEHELPPIVEFKDDSNIEVINNSLYFYSEIERKDVLRLNKELHTKEDELLSMQRKYRLPEPAPIYLHIQSYGGLAHAGLSALDTIKNLQVPVHTIIDGVAASAATFMSIAGTKRYMQKHSYVLIHQISTSFWGTYEQFQDEKKNLDKLMQLLSDIYLTHTKIPEKKLKEILKHDLFFNAEEALEFGIVDEILQEK